MPRLSALKPRVASLGARVQGAGEARQDKRADPFYLTPQWREAREICVALHNWTCAHCARTDCRLFVDHIVERADGGADYEQINLEPLCGACHTAKTHRERVSRAR